MRNLFRAGALAVSAVAALGVAGVLGVTAASASTTVTATTSVTNHPDTTNVSGPGCTSSPGGPVWANDNYTLTMTATQDTTPANTWAVHITVTGTYIGFADPTTCAASLSTGSLNGTYDVTVTSPTAPVASDLKASYTTQSISGVMVPDFFGGKATNVAGGPYNFSYQGSNYSQVSTDGSNLIITGDVKPVACTATVTSPGSQTSVLNTAISGVQVKATSNYPGSLSYEVSNLPRGLTFNNSTGAITGTPTRTGTDVVTINVKNPAFDTEAAPCGSQVSFNWTVSLTAPTPTPSPSHSTAPSTSGSGNAGLPNGGVQTGGGKPASNLPLDLAIALIGFAVLAGGTAVALRKQNAGR